MSQQGKEIEALRKEWQAPLEEAWRRSNLPHPIYHLDMPFYGDELYRLAQELRAGSVAVRERGDAAAIRFSEVQKDILVEMAENAGLTSEAVLDGPSLSIRERGVLNSEWLLGLYRLLEGKFPRLGDVGLNFLEQVDAYLTHPNIRVRVDSLIRPSLLGEPTVVVAHSLGTVASYSILREAGTGAHVPIFITLGSPLGFDVVKRYLRPPALNVPEGVGHWLNASCAEDYVALYPRLDRKSFAADIENISDVLGRSDDPHSIVEYIKDSVISKRIYNALANESGSTSQA